MVVDPDWSTNTLPIVLADLPLSNLNFIQDYLRYGPSILHFVISLRSPYSENYSDLAAIELREFRSL